MLTKMLADKDFSRFWDLSLLVYGFWARAQGLSLPKGAARAR